MKKVLLYVNGLRKTKPGKKGALVGLFDINKEKDAPGRQIFMGEANENGEVASWIPKHYAGKTAKLVIRDLGFKYIDVEVEIQKYGLLYPVKLDVDRFVLGESVEKKHGDLETVEAWKSEKEYHIAQLNALKMAREIKIKNMVSAYLVWVFTALGLGSGFLFSPFIGFMIGLLVFIFTSWLTPMALGMERNVLTKRIKITKEIKPSGEQKAMQSA